MVVVIRRWPKCYSNMAMEHHRKDGLPGKHRDMSVPARGHLYLARGFVISMIWKSNDDNDDNDGLPNGSANSVMGNRAAARAQYLGHSRADAGSPEAFSRGKSWHRFK